MQPEDAVTMSRIATVIKKEEPLEKMLMIVRKRENGIDHEKACNDLNEAWVSRKK